MAKEKSPESGSRAELVRQLEEAATYMEILGENDFKIRAYRKGAAALESCEDELSAIANGAVKITGVGEGLKSAIREFLGKGEVAILGDLSSRVPGAVLVLMQVPGLGPKKALLLHQELGIQTVGELEYACRENRLLGIKGFGEAIQGKVLAGIEQLARNEGKYRWDHRAEDIRSFLRDAGCPDTAIWYVGQMGRHSEILEALEFLVAPFTEEKRILAALKKQEGWMPSAVAIPVSAPKAIQSLTLYSGPLSDGRPLVLWFGASPPEAVTLRWLCADEKVRPILVASPERFQEWEPAWLEMQWIEAGRKPDSSTYRRARDGGVRGIFHCHTDASDGAATLEQMVRAASSAGYEYIGISDHSQSAAYAGGLKPERIKEQRKSIEALQKRVSIRVFHGIESDILADGALDYDDEVLSGLDFIVGSIHSRFKMDLPAMTERLTKALSHPRLTIWGHPTGRLLLGRPGYGLDWERCLKAAAKNKVAVEINANPHRLDVDWRLGAALTRHGVSVCVNPDAHDTQGIADTVYGEYMAEKAMIPRDRILNRLGVSEMEKYLWQKKNRKR